jgi:flagellar basal body-associated protein FliL
LKTAYDEKQNEYSKTTKSMLISILVTSLMFLVCIIMCYYVNKNKMKLEETRKAPYEITNVEILCDQDAFEQAVKDGRIAIGRVVEQA